VRWTVFKSQFCGFAAQKYSTKLQLKNCRLARRYGEAMREFCRIVYGKPDRSENENEYFSTYQLQNTKFTVNGVEYRKINDIPILYIEEVKRALLKNPSYEKYNFIFHRNYSVEFYSYKLFSRQRKLFLFVFLVMAVFYSLLSPFKDDEFTIASLFIMAFALLLFIFTGRDIGHRLILFPGFPLSIGIGKLLGVEDGYIDGHWFIVICTLLISLLPIIAIEAYRIINARKLASCVGE